MAQVPGSGVLLHVSVGSSHVSVVQANPSPQFGPPVQVAVIVQASLIVQNNVSLQPSPVRVVHDVWLVAVRQAWHWFPGFCVPFV
jgi:hypothetical protein